MRRTQEAFNRWYTLKCTVWRSEKVKKYVKMMGKLWCEAWEKLEQITADEVEQYQVLRADGKRSASALNQERMYLDQFLRYCASHSWLRGNNSGVLLANWPRRVAVVKKTYQTLTREEEQRLIEAAEEPWLKTFIALSCATGLRERSVRLLKEESLDRAKKMISCSASSMKTLNHVVVPFPERLIPLLTNSLDGGVVIPMPSETQVWRKVKAAAVKAGLTKKITPHDLRRTFVSRLEALGVNVRGMQDWGLPGRGVLENHYLVGLNPDKKREIAEQL